MFFKFQLLIIEDNLLNQKIISFWLSKKGYEFTFASSGEEALEIFKNKWFDVIIMDIMLPGMNGLETTAILRESAGNQYGRQPFIIALTANTLDNDSKRCLEAGMDDYMAKPFDFQQLNHILDDHFSAK